MIKLSDNVIDFAQRRVRAQAQRGTFKSLTSYTSVRAVCHWDLDPATGRPVRVWTASTTGEDTEASTYLRLAG